MRTSGTFQDVYTAAKSYANGTEDDCPINPVIRRENGIWMLESNLEPATDCDFECDLETFNGWFFDSYSFDEYLPSETDITDFVNA